MSKKQLVIALCFLCVAAGALAFARQNAAPQGAGPNAAKPARNEALVVDDTRPDAETGEGTIPLRVVYRQMFRHYVALKKKAAELEGQGKDGATLRNYYKREAKLADKLDRELDRIAAKTDRDIEQVDRKAKQIIDRYRERFPNGQLKKGETPPPAPPELRELQEEKDRLIARGRDELRQAFGEAEFTRFDEFVRQNVASKMKPVFFDRPRPELPGSPRKPEFTNRKPTERTVE